MRPHPVAPIAHLLARLLPGGVLIWAGAAKVGDAQGSILAVDAYDVLPVGAVRPVAAALPWVELAVGALLVLGLFLRFAGIALAALSAVFIAAMVQAKVRGLAIDCGCFGGGGTGDGVGWWDVLRDVPLLAAGVVLAVRPRGPWRMDRFLEDPHDEREGAGGPAAVEG